MAGRVGIEKMKDMKVEEIRIGNWVKLTKSFTDDDGDKSEFLHNDVDFVEVTYIKDGFAKTLQEHKDGLDYLILWKRYNPLKQHTGHRIGGCGIPFIEPIPLTPEWLERFGFELDKEQECYIICVDEDWCYLLIDANDMSAAIQSTTEEKTGIAVCLHLPLTQYVHQIQNLFYSLSGKELTYKP